MADSCEAYFNDKWNLINIQTALVYPELIKRCVECHGEVRIHKEGGKTSAHAEHKSGNKYCSLGHYYKGGERKMHPNPAKPKTVKLIPTIPEEIVPSKEFIEGHATKILVNSYERDYKARKECLKIYGYKCIVCETSLKDIYGDIAHKIIHVHHLLPLSKIKQKYKVNPREDLRPVCPNCHAVIHSRVEAFTIEEIKKEINLQKAKGSKQQTSLS